MTFGQWLAQGGDYVVYLGAIAAALAGICALAATAYKALTKPTRDAVEASEAGDKVLREDIEQLKEKERQHDAMFASDFTDIKLLKREAARQGESLVTLTEGVYLLVQHAVTHDHVLDMEAWMVRHATQAVSPHIGDEMESDKGKEQK